MTDQKLEVKCESYGVWSAKKHHDHYKKYHLHVHLGSQEFIKGLQKRFGGHFHPQIWKKRALGKEDG